jgi:ferric-dicitrate binding protein FerR (iron transport regulator)
VNDDRTERLLRLAGPRVGVTPDRAERVRQAVRREWLAAAERRRPAKRRTPRVVAGLVGIAAGVVAIAIVGMRHNAAAPAAIVRHISGSSPLVEGAAVESGEWIDVGPGARASLGASGAALRIDGGTRLRFLSARVIELAAGAVYIDSGTTGTGFDVNTPLGTVRDVGTQFEVRIAGRSTIVRVRAGVVELRDSSGVLSAREGAQLTVTAAGVTRSAITRDAPEWDWVSGVPVELVMEGQTLAAFLERAGRAQGWTVRYAQPELEAAARTIVLHGSVNGLSPRQAIAVAVATSGLAHRIEGDLVVVFRP